MKLSKIMGLAMAGVALATSLAGCSSEPTQTPQEAAAAEQTLKINLAQKNEEARKMTEDSYTVLFNRKGCEFGKYTSFNVHKDGSGVYEGRDVNVVICPNKNTETSTQISYKSGKHSRTSYDQTVRTVIAEATPGAAP